MKYLILTLNVILLATVVLSAPWGGAVSSIGYGSYADNAGKGDDYGELSTDKEYTSRRSSGYGGGGGGGYRSNPYGRKKREASPDAEPWGGSASNLGYGSYSDSTSLNSNQDLAGSASGQSSGYGGGARAGYGGGARAGYGGGGGGGGYGSSSVYGRKRRETSTERK